MFGKLSSPPEVIAWFDELFERRYPSTTPESASLLDRISTSWRTENRAAAASFAAIGELFGYRLARCSETEDWAVDTEEAVAAELPRWPSMTQGRLAAGIDKIVGKADADAVRRRRERYVQREVWFADLDGGISHIEGSLFSPDARALDKRLTALAATVCEHDPRNCAQRRADAMGALAAGADRLACRCGRPDCAAGKRPAATPVVIHVIAEEATIAGRGATPASEICADGLIPAELVAELAVAAKQVPLVHPASAEPERGYTPSKALADFVRCRDLTCRWPGCDRPAADCDIDHTIPYARRGPTHASNLKCYCRTHHLVKDLSLVRHDRMFFGCKASRAAPRC
jgi:Domain of unknown function (DUF222)